MADSFVDVTYRGLEVGRRLRIRDFTGDGAYVEAPTPMPVGTSIDLAIDAGVTVTAIVARVHEQVGGSDRAPGMNLRAMRVMDERARAWWDARVADSPAPQAPVPLPVPVPVPVSADRTAPASAESGPIVTDDAARTQVMPVIDPDSLDDDAAPEIVDDGKRTQMMSTVEIEAIMAQANAAPSPSPSPSDDDSGDLDIEVTGDEDVSQDGPATGANGAGAKKKKPRRRKKK